MSAQNLAFELGKFIKISGHRIRVDLILGYWFGISADQKNCLFLSVMHLGVMPIICETLEEAELEAKRLDWIFVKKNSTC